MLGILNGQIPFKIFHNFLGDSRKADFMNTNEETVILIKFGVF